MTPRLVLAVIATALIATCLFVPALAEASTRQVTIVDDESGLNADPVGTLEKLKAMGVSQVKYAVHWNEFAGAAVQSVTPPAGSDQPVFYDGDFAQLVGLDQDAAKVGVQLDLQVTGPAPRWAEGTGCAAVHLSEGDCDVSAPDFGRFVEALGRQFNGSVSSVPAVRWWSIWEEPNYGVNLQPEMSSSTTYSAADEYRSLLADAWTALEATSHTPRTDTILFGELAARGIAGSKPGTNIGIKPIQFLASLYCVTTRGQRLTGRVAAANGCPTAASAFRAQNPALFDASGIAVHPMEQGASPATHTADCHVQSGVCVASTRYPTDPLWVDFASIPTLERDLDQDVRANGATTTFPIWNTEFGYWTNPPGGSRFHCRTPIAVDCDVSPAKAEIYLNQAEYMSYRNPRIASFDQYQLTMPTSGAWTDGLLSVNGTPEPTYDAWEVPLWIPDSSLNKPGATTVWGGAKPAAYDKASTGISPTVAIQYKAPAGNWQTVRTVALSTSRAGAYFTSTVRVTRSGSVRLLYRDGSVSIASRDQAITVR